MKIAVIAANGRSGLKFVEEALKAGHSVRAGVHGSDDFAVHPNLTIVTCDATKSEDLKELLMGQDAVVSFIGHVTGSPPLIQTEAMQKVIEVMIKNSQRRIISLTGTGVRIPGDHITFVDRVLNLSIKLVDPKRINDGIKHAEVLQKSNLEWTIIRVLKLQNTKPKLFTLRSHGPTKLYVSRSDVARAVLQVLEESSFIGEAPIISKP